MVCMWVGDAYEKSLQQLERLAPQVDSVITGIWWFSPGYFSLFTVLVISCEIHNCTLEGAFSFI